MNVKVLSKPRCVQCDATKRKLEKLGVAYEEVDLTVDADALNEALSLGYQSAPVVIVGDKHWSGFRPDKLEALVLQEVA